MNLKHVNIYQIYQLNDFQQQKPSNELDFVVLKLIFFYEFPKLVLKNQIKKSKNQSKNQKIKKSKSKNQIKKSIKKTKNLHTFIFFSYLKFIILS
jgi:hypothetical protein